MDFVAISDIHFNLNNLKPASQSLRFALEMARFHKVPLVIGGDLNDTKSVVRGETLNLLLSLFKEFSDVTVYILVGNHDLLNHNSKEHSLEFLKLLQNVSVIDKTSYIGDWAFIPYHHNEEEFVQEVKRIEETTPIRNLVIHQGVMGAMFNDYLLDEQSISMDTFKGFDNVLSGHYHRHQRIGLNFMYFGSPYSVSFAEANHNKCIWLIQKLKDKYHQTPIDVKGVRKHIQFEFEEGRSPVAHTRYVNQDDLIKVVVKGDKAFCHSMTKEKIKEFVGDGNITLVPVITKQMSYRLKTENAHDVKGVVMDYLDKAQTTLNKDKLKEYVGRLM